MSRPLLTGRLLDGLGWGGATASLSAYALNSLGALGSQSLPYLLLNVLGCGLLMLYTYHKRAFANTTLNSIWLLVTLAALAKSFTPSPTPLESRVNQLVAAYNVGDARTFADQFAPDAAVYEHPQQLTQAGRKAVFSYYQGVFRQFPALRTTLLHRIVIGNRVMDHERVQRGPDQPPFEVLAIYELHDGLVQRLDFVREARHIAPR